MIAWTTTPWTLPSNIALCVHPDLDYVKIKGLQGSEMVQFDGCFYVNMLVSIIETRIALAEGATDSILTFDLDLNFDLDFHPR